ncbi:HNH endonuclease [Mycobacterium sp. OAE908]|uniref:HNH endonuclease family protein n=1 Tax=Mycobacterium sp. OAE908 TaxID=2817899 RepID=UPI001AE35E2E
MTRNRLLWLVLSVALAVVVAVQVTTSDERGQFVAQADIPTVAPGVDVLADIPEVPFRIRSYDYHRDAFGDSWTDDNPAPGGHNGCDTRNDILDRDLVDKTYVSIKRCPKAVATGILHDPYTNTTVAFTRGAQIGAAVQIDHIVPLALAWDLGARNWPDDMRVRFANDPANLIAVEGQANQDKGDKEPAVWLPPNHAFWCQYAVQFANVLRGYGLPVDAPSATALRDAAATCPTG